MRKQHEHNEASSTQLGVFPVEDCISAIQLSRLTQEVGEYLIDTYPIIDHSITIHCNSLMGNQAVVKECLIIECVKG
jgi:hypothetical protein